MLNRLVNNVTWNQIIYLFPFLYLVHDIEEILTIETFLNHADKIPLKVTTEEFLLAFLLLWLVAIIGCFQASKQRKFLGLSGRTFFSFLVIGIFLANGIGHLFQFFYFRGYVPGVITAIVIIIPYSLLTLTFLLKEYDLTVKQFCFFLLVGAIIQGPVAISAIFISKIIV